MKQTIEHLQNDVILANSIRSSSPLSASKSTQQHHNLFQTFRVSVRMFSLTVLHYDPVYSAVSSTSPSSRSSSSASNMRRFIVERIKPTCDAYFDLVSTIDTSSLSAASSVSAAHVIDKSAVGKYHQVCRSFHL